MSRAGRAGAGWFALGALAALTACTHGPLGGAANDGGAGSIGYVRMDELVQKHPLYEQLARYDRSIAAFDLTSAAPQAVAADPQMRAREAELQRELTAAADRTRKLLDQKQRQYQAQESQAIAAALRGANVGGASAAQIAGSVNVTAQQQQGVVASQAQRDLQSYRTTLIRQNQAQIAAAQKALSDRAARTYRVKAEELQSKESALSLSMANQDASARLALHTKLSSLALDDAAREDAQKQLQALDRKESDALAAQRNRDQQTLATLQAELHAQVQTDLNQTARGIQQRTAGSMTQRQAIVARQAASVGGAVIQTTTVGGRPQQQVNPNLPPSLRSRIQRLSDVVAPAGGVDLTPDALKDIESLHE